MPAAITKTVRAVFSSITEIVHADFLSILKYLTQSASQMNNRDLFLALMYAMKGHVIVCINRLFFCTTLSLQGGGGEGDRSLMLAHSLYAHCWALLAPFWHVQRCTIMQLTVFSCTSSLSLTLVLAPFSY